MSCEGINLMRTLLFGVAYGIASFVSTRGSDGEFLFFLCSFGILAVLYWATLVKFRPQGKASGAMDFVVCEAGAIVGMAGGRLDEMAGMLYPFIVCSVGATIAVGSGVIAVLSARTRNDRADGKRTNRSGK